MLTKEILERSDKIWKWARTNIQKPFYEFHEICKFENLIKIYGYRYHKTIADGGITIVIQNDRSSVTLAKVRENCYSEGAVLDLLEVYGLYGRKNDVYVVDSNEAFSMFLNSLRLYESKMKAV